MKEALLRDDAADQESDEQNDPDRLPADAIELIDGGGQPKPARIAESTEEGGCRHSIHQCEVDGILPRRSDRHADLFQARKQSASALRHCSDRRLTCATSSKSPR